MDRAHWETTELHSSLIVSLRGHSLFLLFIVRLRSDPQIKEKFEKTRCHFA